jgi:hypothetical protein
MNIILNCLSSCSKPPPLSLSKTEAFGLRNFFLQQWFSNYLGFDHAIMHICVPNLNADLSSVTVSIAFPYILFV